MSTLFGPILAAALLAQFQGGTLQGTVVDDQGKPVADAQVVFHAPAPGGGKVQPVEVRTKTDAEGRYRLTTPPLGGVYILLARVWAYRAGTAITAALVDRSSAALVLRKPEPRTVKIEGPDGQPVAGASVSPRVVSFAAGGPNTDVPDTLAAPRAVTTGPDGRATLDYLADGDILATVRITAESIGTQDFQLIERPGRAVQGATITIRLKPTSRLSGRVRNRAGQPVASQVVEIWFQGAFGLPTNPVGFKDGPLRTAADGSFQTPDNLLVGSPYKVVVRAPGMEPILSDWITIGEKPRSLLPMIQRPLRTISGRVVDRQGRPVTGVEVFQAGDGPERTATMTDTDGRFSLGGFQHGPVFLFARSAGYRFFGRLIKPGDGDITVDLTRTGERPTREMRMLPDPIPLEESRALARRLIEPYWEAFENKNEVDKIRILQSLATADPAGVLRKLEELEFPNAAVKSRIQGQVARALARIDPIKAAALAESIEGPNVRALALVVVADALPERERDRRLALLDAAAVQSKAATDPIFRFYQMGEVAERWYELGERDKAKALFEEGLRPANQTPRKTDWRRGSFAARLARVDLPSALAIAKEFPARGIDAARTSRGILGNIAFHLAADNPAEAERVLRQIPQETGRDWLPPAVAWKMAPVDPTRAQKLVEESQRYFDDPQMYLFLALGLKSRNPAAAHQAFQTAMQGIDRLTKEGAGYRSTAWTRGVLLPLVEQIDPALVPELFWHAVAMRPPIGDPRRTGGLWNRVLVVLLAWYDRDVAAALFEPIRAQMEDDDLVLTRSHAAEFWGWSTFDPRAAVARLEKVPVSPKLELNADSARREVSQMLQLSHEARWRWVWLNFTDMAGLFDRDL